MDVSIEAVLDSDELPDDYKTCIYRVVQEALHNCAKHSQAASVRIRVEQTRDRLLLSIRDDGRGFDAVHTKGLGLLGIQERVTRLGGTCQVNSTPGSGATLSIELPVGATHATGDHGTGDQQERDNPGLSVRETNSHPVG
jgi:signal transduction histidine kinase